MMIARFLTAGVMLFAVSLSAAEKQQPAAPAKPVPPPYKPVFRTNLNPVLFEDQVQASELIKQREALIQKLIAERQRILQTDQQAKRLHAEIMANYKKLAVIMENKRAIRDLDRELRLLDSKIEKLPLKKTPAAPAKK